MHERSDLSYAYPVARGLPSLIILFATPFIFNEELTLQNELIVDKSNSLLPKYRS